MESVIGELSVEIARKTEASLQWQMNDFISRGLIVIEYGPQTLVRMPDSNKVEYRQTVSLKLKDLEYIEKLEAEVARLRKIEAICGMQK